MYKYEMHQHTAPCSACGRADPVKTVYALKEAGFAGMVLTNHFLHGNTGIDRDLDWKSFVAFYEKDYLLAKEAGEKADFDVIFGIEEHIGKGKELLLYGITPELLYSHPEMSDGKIETVSRAVREFGGLVFQAHPYRNRDYITDPDENLPLCLLDGFEVMNQGNKGDEDERAAVYAKEHGLLVSAGSDAHKENMPVRFGIESPERIRDSAGLVKRLKSGDYSLFRIELF